MARRIRRWPWLLLAAATLALVVRSVAVRVDDDAPAPDGARPLFIDPPTGALLVDLVDGASASDRRHVAALVDRAIAPLRWPKGVAALGQELSASAQLFRVTPPPGETGDVMRALRGDPDVEGVEVERTWSLLPGESSLVVSPGQAARGPSPSPSRPGRFVPNDPYYKHQWHLDQIGMPTAWTMSRGSGVVVAVIDTGVLSRDYRRFRRAPDLAKTKFVPGRDFVDGDASPDDEHGHGTHVAGTIAQSTNNGVGVAGVAPAAAIMPIRVLDKRGAGRWGAIAAGIRWAADHGANVINMSLGGGMPSKTVGRAIDYAHRKGVVIVAAAGNASTPRVGYPASHPHVISVGAVRYDEQLSFYSSYGRGLDLVAPGGDLRVDQNGDGMPDGVLQNTMVRGDPGKHDYLAWQGTSMASPHVAGVAALIEASGVRNPDTVEALLERTAKSKGDRRHYGAGLLQAPSALRAAQQGLPTARALLAVVLGLLAFAGLRRRNRLDVRPAPAIAVAAVLAGGLALLPWYLLGGPGRTLMEGADGLAGLAGAVGPWVDLALLSALVPLVLVSLLLGVRRLRPLVVGAAIAFAATLIAEATVPTVALALLSPWLVGPWLVGQAVLVLAVARLAATRR